MTTDSDARDELIDLAADFYDQFAAGRIPEMELPTRTKSNIEYDTESGGLDVRRPHVDAQRQLGPRRPQAAEGGVHDRVPREPA